MCLVNFVRRVYDCKKDFNMKVWENDISNRNFILIKKLL